MTERENWVKKVKRKLHIAVILTLSLVWLVMGSSQVEAVEARFRIEPSTIVKVGEEVFFDASGSTDDIDKLINEDDNLSNPFRWDFGDGYAMDAASPYFHPDDGGVSATHFYMSPGTYTVTLTVTDRDGESGTATTTITVEGAELYPGFELWHADFHGHIAQYIYPQIPTEFTGDLTNRINITIAGDTGFSKVLLDKTNLQAEEKFLLNNSELPAGNYTLRAQILDSGSTVLAEITEEFAKPYDGIPKVGIDENNAIRLNGELFFPITPFGLHTKYYDLWKTEGYINTLLGINWNLVRNPSDYGLSDGLDAWKFVLNEAALYDFPFVGPTMWDGLSGSHTAGMERRDADISRLVQYINETKDHPSMFTWSWLDEPDLGNYNGYAPPFVVRSWVYKCHQLDPQHLVFHLFVGYDYSPQANLWHEIQEKKFCYVYNKDMFGGKRTFVSDVYGMDYYPYEYYGRRDYISVADMVLAIKNMREWTHDLVPFLASIEIADLDRWPNTPAPTPAQVKHIAWLNVVHGAKMFLLFHYFVNSYPDQSPEVYAAFAEVVDHITQLTPVILGPEIDREVTDDADTPGRRVDTMIREYNNSIYIIAVRLTEPPEEFDPPITVTFNVEGVGSATAEVFDESRTIKVAGGSFQDTFAPNGVHIYKIIREEERDIPEAEADKTEVKCYNNVFNPTKGEEALIWVELPKQARVKLVLYNTRGKKIRELVDKEEDPGIRKYPWDGTNDSGNIVGSGLYFVHIQAGDYKKTKKIVVVK